MIPILAASLLGAMVALERSVIFPRWTIPRAGEPEPAPGVERLFLQTGEGRIEAWFLPGRRVSAERPGPLVVFAHGNGELIDYWPAVLEPYRELGVSVLLPEYRGYGRSAGSPSEQAIVADFAAFLDRTLARPEVDRERLVFHGRSLGGGVVVQLATQRRPRALILQSTFTSIHEMAKGFLIPRRLVLDPFDSIGVLPGLGLPALIMHGRADGVVPPEHAERLARATPGARLVWYEGGHNDCPRDWNAWFEEIRAHLVASDVLPPP